MKKASFSLFLVSLLALSLYPTQKESDLKAVLRSAPDYCDKVKNIALYYVARENIEDKKYIYKIDKVKDIFREAWKTKYVLRGSKKTSYECDYQLISRNGQYEEKRVLLAENGRKKHQDAVELTKLRFVSKYLIFGLVGVLSRYWQSFIAI